jgi:hypothetical protein
MILGRINGLSFTAGTLVVDIFDSRTKPEVWRGTVSDTILDKAEKTVEKRNKAIEKMFKNFPPKKS